MITIQILAETEYQDLYRVTDGVLLVVNKFKPMTIRDVINPRVSCLDKSNSTIYCKGCQKELKKLTKNYKHDFGAKWEIPKGTVLYNHIPVVLADEWEYTYEIKTTANAFSGTDNQMENMLSDILYRIRQGKCR